jgi:hypothetical protein
MERAMALYRRKIKSALEAATGWTVKTHTTGIVDVYPPSGMPTDAAKREVLHHVRELGYEPTIIGTSDAKGVPCIQFHTPETLSQEGEGSHGFRRAQTS